MIGAGAAGLGLVGAGYLGLAGEDNTTRDDVGAVVEAGEVGAFRIRLGDCLADAPQGEFESIEAVPCGQPHGGEVYHAFNLVDDEYPGLASIRTSAELGCYDAFEPFVGIAFEESQYGISMINPTEQSWDEVDDREVLCLVSNFDGTTKTGSAAATGL